MHRSDVGQCGDIDVYRFARRADLLPGVGVCRTSVNDHLLCSEVFGEYRVRVTPTVLEIFKFCTAFEIKVSKIAGITLSSKKSYRFLSWSSKKIYI